MRRRDPLEVGRCDRLALQDRRTANVSFGSGSDEGRNVPSWDNHDDVASDVFPSDVHLLGKARETSSLPDRVGPQSSVRPYDLPRESLNIPLRRWEVGICGSKRWRAGSEPGIRNDEPRKVEKFLRTPTKQTPMLSARSAVLRFHFRARPLTSVFDSSPSGKRVRESAAMGEVAR